MAILTGTVDADYIQGTPEDDSIDTLGGDDTVFADAGDDRVVGGAGDDELFGDDGNDELDGGAGSDSLDGGSGNDELAGGGGIDFIGGGDGADLAYGGWGDDTIGGGAGRDRLFGEAGADILNGEAGNDSLFGGSGDDYMMGGAGDDTLYSGPGRDFLSGGSGMDHLYGNDGADTLEGGIGDDLYGEAGDDVLIWNSEQTVLEPYQTDPNSVISGGEGYDTLRVDVDLLYYRWNTGEFQPGPFVSNINLYHAIYGGFDPFIKLGDSTPEDVPGLSLSLDGIERIEVSSGTGSLIYSNSAFPDDPYSGPSNLPVVGTGNDDQLWGGYGDEVLIGGAGDDDILGGLGTDRLEGGVGRDTLQIGEGEDTASGGSGADAFVYAFDIYSPTGDEQSAYGSDGNDIVLDFSAAERDVLRLDAWSDLTPAQAAELAGNPDKVLVTQTADNAMLTFAGDGATIRFDALGTDQIGAIGGDTLQALEAKLIGIAGDSSYDPFQFV
jgi:Ca2+-binding RTX toxin-like protein